MYIIYSLSVCRFKMFLKSHMITLHDPLSLEYFISLSNCVLPYIHDLFFPSSLTVVSWFLSPLLSGITSAVLFYFVRMFILQKVRKKPLPGTSL